MKVENNFFDFRKENKDVGSIIKIGDLELNSDSMTLSCGDKKYVFSQSSRVYGNLTFQTLHLILNFSSKDWLCTRDQICNWIDRDRSDDEDIPISDVVVQNINRLNDILKSLGSQYRINSAGYGFGYKLVKFQKD